MINNQEKDTYTAEALEYNQNVIDAMNEAQKIAKDSKVKGYTSMDDLIAALDEADLQAETTTERLTHETVFANAREAIHSE